jgi:hypothetical protein
MFTFVLNFIFVILYLFLSRGSHKLYEIQGPQNLDLPLVLDEFKKQEN